MATQSLLEKLQLGNDKTVLIQGLPSSIERSFSKVTFAKNMTPLLKIKKIDFALIFALSSAQLHALTKDMLPALKSSAKLWIAYPKPASKIVSDLNKNYNWQAFAPATFLQKEEVELDSVWNAILFATNEVKATDNKVVAAQSVEKIEEKKSIIPVELANLFVQKVEAKDFFETLSAHNQKQYITWIAGAKTVAVREKRSIITIEKLLDGKKSPLEK